MITPCAIHPLVLKYFEDCKCKGCDKEMGGTSMPCRFCNPSTVQAEAVVKTRTVTYAKDTRVVAKHKSSSQPNVVYEVRADKTGKFLGCTCPGYFYRQSCWHKTHYEEGKK
jgi:hypothetical protein